MSKEVSIPMNQSHFSCIYLLEFCDHNFVFSRLYNALIRADEKSQGHPFSCRGMDSSKFLKFSIKYWFGGCVIQHGQHNSFDVRLSHCPTEHRQTES